jgi:branched-chain amino acid aminotransferase
MSTTSATTRADRIWIDGRIVAADDAHLSAFDRGFQLGDGVFETLRVRGGRPTELDQHLARLRSSAAGLEIPIDRDIDDQVAAGLAELLVACGLDDPMADASIRITVSRGPYRGRGLLPPDEVVRPTVVIQAWPVVAPRADHLERGLHLVPSAVRRDPASPLAALKTTSRADYVYARLEARRAGADDAVFLTTDGHLSEGTSANLFIVRGDELATPSLDCAVLPGTTRSWLLAWGERVGLRPVEERLLAKDLAGADEAFLSSSVAGVLPVTRFAGKPIGGGHPGPWTRRARADRESMIGGGEGGPVGDP